MFFQCSSSCDCEDLDLCTCDSCVSGSCLHPAKVCTPPNDCYTATCNKLMGCVFTRKANGSPCGPSGQCPPSTCQSGVCTPGSETCCTALNSDDDFVCGLCENNCGGSNKQAVLNFFGVSGRVNAGVTGEGGAGGGNDCPSTQVCCFPEDQSTVTFSSTGQCQLE
jgi:hypothetical protein